MTDPNSAPHSQTFDPASDAEARSNGSDSIRELPSAPQPQAPGLLARGLRNMVSLGVDLATLPVRVLRPIVMSETLAPARTVANEAVNTVVDASVSVVGDTMRGNEEFNALIGAIVARLLKELRASDLVADLIRTQVGLFLDYLVQNPATLAPLVETVAANYLRTLRQNPTLLRPLVRAIAGDYLDYIGSNPEILETVVDGAADGFMTKLRSQPESLDGLVRAIGDRYVEYLSVNPAVISALVDKAAAGFLTVVEEDPARLDGVVRVVGDRYLEYLNDEPDAVQALLQGQSQNLAENMLNEVRERSANGDYALEDLFRRILRRRPRSQGE